MKYINVIIDNKRDHTDMAYTYACEDDNVNVGSMVYVPFARSKKSRSAYVISIIEDENTIDETVKKKIKYVDHIDEEISLTGEMVRSAVWMRDRYLCRYIDALKCFTPAGTKAVRKVSVSPVDETDELREESPELTPEQKKTLDEIDSTIQRHVPEIFLIHGVTGSGKTEVYIRAAQTALKNGRSVIMLVPEISLTAQTINRFAARFGSESIAVLHSKLTLRQRYDQWQKIRRGEVRIVIGARSAVFAPVTDLGLIVIDEEHESTYKSDSTPKYDTAEVAAKRLRDSSNRGALVMGSATPSVVSYSRASEGIYRLLNMTKRYNGTDMPSSEIVDMREELKAGNRSVLSRRMVNRMNRQLDNGRQIILLMNRRGYSTFISCRECGYVAKCPNCGLSLTYHKRGTLECHYCGYSETAPVTCPECGSKYIKYFGTGTEKVQEEISEIFDQRTVERIDLDSVRKKGELNRKLKAFAKGKTDILIGTQMIAKGLDFNNVGLVGIVSADVSLNIPDFRAPERTFQLITQAAGRAGRREEKGEVIIQTYSPDNYAVRLAADNDYETFYKTEMKFRKFMVYPPMSDIFMILFTAASPDKAAKGAAEWYDKITTELGKEKDNVFRPQEAYMSRIKDTYRYSFIIKCPRGQRRRYTRIIRSVKDNMKSRKQDYNAVVDINPYSFT